MSIERIVGIDFGTSTSVVKVKTYKDNEPIGSVNAVEYVHFDNKASLPTLVYVTEEGKHLIGYEAENAAVKGILHQNFKLDLIQEDPELKKQAFCFTEIFFQYMYDQYNEQKPHFPDCDIETTYVSYPAKWPEGLRGLMTDIAVKAGFVNVIGMDEPTAAIHTVLVQENEKLILGGKDYINLLMVDMGAGTTDLVLCRYSPYDSKHITILNTWPKADNTSLFGGREIDEAICDYVKAYLIDCGLKNTKNFNPKYQDKCKRWKETNLSPIFRDKGGVVRYCGFIDTLLAMLDVNKDFPPMTRTDFEDMLSKYLSEYPRMITDCLADIGFDGGQLDYVILTGGHSQWYFTSEILEGKLTRFGVPDLPKIKEDPKRIIKLSIPQETVAIGLVLQKIAVKHPERPSIKVTGIINLIADHFIDRTGVDLLSDSTALKRIEEAAKKAVIDLETLDKVTIDIPYISANQSGPLHLTEMITRAELTSFIQRYQKNAGGNESRSSQTDESGSSSGPTPVRSTVTIDDDLEPDEAICTKCGNKILLTDAFCSVCGTKNEKYGFHAETDEVTCPKCGKNVASSYKFCCYCGAFLQNKPIHSTGQTISSQKVLLMKREMQFVSSGVFYKVIVNGIDYGNLNIGQSKSIIVTSDIATIEINCTTILLTNNHLHCKVRLGANPCISFKIQYPAEIIPTFTDVEVFEYY